MTMLKKLSVAALFAAMVSVAVAATATIYFAVSVPSPGQWKFGSGLGQVTHVRINNAVPTTGTVTLAWVSNDKTVTNAAFLTATCTNGAYEADVTGGPWILAGDYIYRAGTVTSTNECTLILSGNQ